MIDTLLAKLLQHGTEIRRHQVPPCRDRMIPPPNAPWISVDRRGVKNACRSVRYGIRKASASDNAPFELSFTIPVLALTRNRHRCTSRTLVRPFLRTGVSELGVFRTTEGQNSGRHHGVQFIVIGKHDTCRRNHGADNTHGAVVCNL